MELAVERGAIPCLINIGAVLMEPVIAHFILYPEQDEDRAGHADGQARDIDKGKSLGSPKVPKSDLQAVSEHNACLRVFISSLRKCQIVNYLIINALY